MLTFVFALPLVAQVPAGDAHFARRAEGARGAQAHPRQIDAAIAAYERAITNNRDDLVAHARLLRALRFKGAYVGSSNEERKAIFGTAKVAGEQALRAVAKAVTLRGGKPSASEREVAASIRGVPGAADIYLWDAVIWGEWALAYGKLAAARQGAADRIRRHATIATLADPKLEGGAPARVLGRLHNQTPRIPFLTGWASSAESLRFLRESAAHDPSNKLTLLFLAEALVANDSTTKPQAVELLRRVLREAPHADYVVEDLAAQKDARALLTMWGVR